MAFFKNKYISLSLVCIILLIIIFYWIHFLSINKYIVECFTSGYSSSVDLPLTTKYSCNNFCGPNARCSISGQQCMADIDCPGCQPYSPPLSKSNDNVIGDNDAGKLTIGTTPQYSSLTSGYGTNERIITDDYYSKPPNSNFGVNTWITEFQEEQNLFNKRYKPNEMQYMPNYSDKYTLSGILTEDGPLPSNY
jgi:hypothetical protein